MASACAVCGSELVDDSGVCRHHVDGYTGDRWAENNRLLCDMLHRDKMPARLSAADRRDRMPGLDEEATHGL